jgi:hypothetical protein
MARGKNPDGSSKKYPADARRRSQRFRDREPYTEAIVVPPNLRNAPNPSAWTQNPATIRRVEQVERGRLAGLSAYEISQQMGLPAATVMDDWSRINELWLARVSRTQDDLRGEAVRRLDNVIRNGLEILRMDEQYTQAVLFDLPVVVTCQGRQEHRSSDLLLSDPLGQPLGTTYGDSFSCIAAHQMRKRVFRDEKGSASYRRVAGQILQAINSAIMSQARIQGLVVERKALTDTAGRDLPAALKAILLGEEPPDPAALPEPMGLDVSAD